MIAYLDSSVVISKVLGERSDFLDTWKKISRAYSSRLLRVECLRTVERFRLHNGLTDSEYLKLVDIFEEHLSQISLMSLDDRLIDQAGRPMGTRLRALDAIHITSARILRDESRLDLIFLTHDRELSETARVMGFKVEGI